MTNNSNGSEQSTPQAQIMPEDAAEQQGAPAQPARPRRHGLAPNDPVRMVLFASLEETPCKKRRPQQQHDACRPLKFNKFDRNNPGPGGSGLGGGSGLVA
ncbi:hypothetical protein [Candidatus Synchoanobacter obligatus]|uniref:Uncharacterized protein n=1 Tax=Candidatus Synchoanobacter obligatus TaxID=2919597 RepID=A0ABT1L4Z5_9GAMM|nr:hypothetical protein [Candidatus Synchoanobacter obligatus]MCP8352252.1 hypothetical protein [Candidatus Synchoanobacter obligatus]